MPPEASFIGVFLVMVAFYLITIRPGQKEQKRHQQTIRDMREGDEVETTAGFLGTITNIDTPESGPVHITIDFGNGIEIRALTTSVIRRLSSAEEREEQLANTQQETEEALPPGKA